MRTSARIADRRPPAPADDWRPPAPGEAGFTLVEMLVAMVLLGLVGLALARFQTFQLANTASLATAAAARLEADNQAVDVLVAPAAPVSDSSGTSVSAGRTLHWSHRVGPSPDPALMPDLVSVEIRVALTPDGAPLATRSVLRPRGFAGQPPA